MASKMKTKKSSSETHETLQRQPTERLFQKDPTADVILRSMDLVDFRAHKLILSFASPLFRDMFNVGKSSGHMPGQNDGRSAVVPMKEETADVVEKLLRLCYPVEPPSWESASQIHPVLAAAIKYQLETISTTLRKELMSPRFLQSEPLRIFAIACHLKLSDEARVAAVHTLRQPMIFEGAIKELQFVSSLSVYRLFEFREASRKAVTVLAVDSNTGSVDLVSKDTDWVWFTCAGIFAGKACPASPLFNRQVTPWWFTYLGSASSALSQKPSGSSVTSDSTLLAALNEASACNKCSSKAYSDLARFSKLLAAAVDKKVEEISKTYDFCATW